MNITGVNSEGVPIEVSELICIKCGKREYVSRHIYTRLKDIPCSGCGPGYMIETGQRIGKEYLIPWQD
jgi:hypothetical protein